MLRSLLIRQSFFWVDITLAVAFVVTVGAVVYGLLSPPKVDAMSVAAEPVDADAFQLAKVEDRSAYGSIISSGLFDDAGNFDADAEPPPPPPEPIVENVEQTKLSLRLIGTTVVPGFSSAIIEEKDKRNTAATYLPDEAIMDNVTLLEIDKRSVLILNERGGEKKRERLSMDDEDNRPQVAQAPQRQEPEPDRPTGGIQRITLNRQELMNEIMTSYSDIVTKVRPELARDENGDVLGVTANNISQIPLARKLGLNNGDILQTVNNEKIDSEGKIYEMIQKYQNASSLRIGVMSNGAPKVITYRLN